MLCVSSPSTANHLFELKFGFANETSDETYVGLSEADFALRPYFRYAGAQRDQLTTRHSSDAERLREAKELAAQLDVCLILRGESTAICLPSGSVLFDVTGNSALSRPGCQQVLYGLIIGLLAQYRSSMTAAMIGVHLHGLAAELYSGKQSQRSLVAGDLLPQISRAYHQLDL